MVKRRTRDREVPGSIPINCKCCFLEQETLSTLLSTGFYPGKKRATWKISTRLLNALPSINKVDYYYYYYYLFSHVDNEHSHQTARIHILIWVLFGRNCLKIHLLTLQLIYFQLQLCNCVSVSLRGLNILLGRRSARQGYNGDNLCRFLCVSANQSTAEIKATLKQWVSS